MKENQDFNKRLNEAIKKGRDKKSGDGLENAKILPQARDLEEAVLGAVMLEAEAFDKVVEIIKPESFYVDAHLKIFRAMQKLYEENQPIDILTVNEKLKLTGDLDMVGGSYFIASLTNKVSSSANIEFHARIIAQKHLQRELINVSGEMLKDAYDDTVDVFDLLDKAISNNCKLFINSDTVLDRFVSPYSLTKRHFQEWLFMRKNTIKVINMQLEHFYGPGCSKSNFITSMIDRREYRRELFGQYGR